MSTQTLTALLKRQFPTFRARWCSGESKLLIPIVENYLKEVFEGHTIVEMERRADFHKCDVTLQLDITVKLRDGSLLTNIICDLGSYDIHCPEDGVELIKKFNLSEEFEGLVWYWLDRNHDDDDGSAQVDDMEPPAKRQRMF